MKAIQVALIAFPDGSTVFLRDPTPDDVRTANQGWRDSLTAEELAQHQQQQTIGGCVMLRMLEADYQAIPATNHPAILALSAGGNDSE